MNTNEKILDEIVGFSVDIQRYEATVQNEVLAKLKTLENKVIKELRESGVADTIRKQTQQKRLRELLSRTRETISEAYKDIAKEQLKTLKEVALLSELHVISSVNRSLGAVIVKPSLSKTMINTIASETLIEGAPTKVWWSRRTGEFQSRFADTVRMGMMQGIPTDQIVASLRGTKINRYKDGAFSTTKNLAKSLVRSSIQTVANTANVAAFDNRTSDICMALDGLQWDMDYKPIGHNKIYPGATAHWNCRSRQTPVTKSWKELGAKRKFKEIPKSTRASMDGQVSGGKNYEEWLRGKSKAFQVEVLGVEKRKLWMEGKIGFSDLINQRGNPLTLVEIKAKIDS